jgi:hypothetical protein
MANSIRIRAVLSRMRVPREVTLFAMAAVRAVAATGRPRDGDDHARESRAGSMT